MPRNMSDEPRRSGRATKGQHKNASSSPAPSVKPTKNNKAKANRKSTEADLELQHNEDDEEDEEVIRCICGNTNPKDKRAFIGCDACTVWQHNVCMGVHDDEDDVPEHYFCEECRPEEHPETVQAIERGEKIWETRNRIFQNEKKMSKSRKSKAKNGEDYRPGWLKKDLPIETKDSVAPRPESDVQEEVVAETVEESAPEPVVQANNTSTSTSEVGSKRKRAEDEDQAEQDAEVVAAPEDKPVRASRQNKRRKSSTAAKASVSANSAAAVDVQTALVSIDKLPPTRSKPARALADVIATAVQEQAKSTFKVPKGQTAKSLGDRHGAAIEYALHMNFEGNQQAYTAQFRVLHANLKKNIVLVQRLLDGSLTADEISTMSSSDMASEDLQRQRAEMKEVLDRQATVDQADGPTYAQDHKGYHLVETAASNARTTASVQAKDVKEPPKSTSPPQPPQKPSSIDTSKQHDRRSSSQHFDMSNIWAKTANSPTLPVNQTGAPRPILATPRRRSSVHRPQAPANGAKDDPDVDRMLQDNDETYNQSEGNEEAVVWRGKLVQTSEESAPVVNARFVAGRDLQPATLWQNLLPRALSIDGRLQIGKAEDYLCGLRWSHTSDVSVLQLTPADNMEAFNSVFDYFYSRKRYAVVEKDKPTMVKDLYIIPVEVGEALPGHVEMLQHCALKAPVQERLLLATLIIARAPDSPVKADATEQAPVNGHLPQHVRQSIGGPAGSPLNPQNATFSPPNVQSAGYGGPPAFPPNPYQAQQQQPAITQAQQPHTNPQIAQILGDLQQAPTAQLILASAPNLTVEQLQNLRAILEEDINARTDFNALTRRLYN
ncbi:putative Zinc finger, PHD-type, transcription elongation factor S-II, central [Septoria linicola]|nr:putative Zinc finger, PHD-type, transcription elongation factor S-II, central [Septoria linicola]